MDVRLPDENGDRVVKRIRNNEEHQCPPVIAITAQSESPNSSSDLSEVFDKRIGKPVKRDQLLRELSRFLETEESSTEIGWEVDGSLKDSLEEGVLDTFREARRTGGMEEIEGFAEKLIITGKEKENERLVYLGDSLKKDIDEYNITRMNKKLDRFERAIES